MTFTKAFGKFVCEGDTLACDVDGMTATATVYRDDNSDAPDQRQDGFWPSRKKTDAGYVEPAKFDEEHAKATEVMRAWKADEWFYCGVAVTIEKADVQLVHKYGAALWGVECNYPGSDNSYLRDVANELLPEALDAARERIKILCEMR